MEHRISGLHIVALAAWAGLLLYFHAQEEGWVPLLDSANLAFHEAGHPLFGMISESLMVYGGTLMQMLLPAVATFELWRQGQLVGAAACIIWFAENLFNIARYMADARAHELPLVGGLDPEYAHDWTEILNRWGLLQLDTTLAAGLRLIAFVLMVAAVGGVLLRKIQQD